MSDWGGISALFRDEDGAFARDRSIMAVAAAVFFAILAVHLLAHGPDNDVLNFYNFAEMVKDGQVPYRDFVLEFPPFSLIPFIIPSLFTSDLNVYAALYGIEMVLVSLVCLHYLLRIADHMRVSRVAVSLIFIVLMSLYLGEMIKKFDAVPMALTVMALYHHMKGRTGPAYALAMCGALVKMYPVLLLIVFAIADLADRRGGGAGKVARGLGVCVAVGLVAVLPLMACGASIGEIMSFATFHGDRGFQVESVMGTVIQGLGILGLTTFEIVPANYTWDVVGPISDALLPVWTPFCAAMLALAFAAIGLHAYRSGREGTHPNDMVLYATAVILMFLLTNKVFSAQYMMWLFPLMALLPMASGGRPDARLSALMVLEEALVILMLFTYNIGQADFVAIGLLRDGILLLMLAGILAYLLAGRGYFARLYARHPGEERQRPQSSRENQFISSEDSRPVGARHVGSMAKPDLRTWLEASQSSSPPSTRRRTSPT